MANNRVMLVCNVCIPPGTNWVYQDALDGKVIHMGKWYPGSAYYNAPTKATLEEFYESHHHPELASEDYGRGAGQDNPVRLEYESVSMPKRIIDIETPPPQLVHPLEPIQESKDDLNEPPL